MGIGMGSRLYSLLDGDENEIKLWLLVGFGYGYEDGDEFF